jgi:hypothetical protein
MGACLVAGSLVALQFMNKQLAAAEQAQAASKA